MSDESNQGRHTRPSVCLSDSFVKKIEWLSQVQPRANKKARIAITSAMQMRLQQQP